MVAGLPWVATALTFFCPLVKLFHPVSPVTVHEQRGQFHVLSYFMCAVLNSGHETKLTVSKAATSGLLRSRVIMQKS